MPAIFNKRHIGKSHERDLEMKFKSGGFNSLVFIKRETS